MVKINVCMTSCVTEFLLCQADCVFSRWSSISAPLLCSSVHVDTTEMKQLKFMVITLYCVNMNDIDNVVLLLVHLFCLWPPETNQWSITVILPKKCKIMLCVILKSCSGLLLRLKLLSNFLMALSYFLYINQVFLLLIVTLYNVPLQ